MPVNLPAGFKNEPTEEAQKQRIAALKGTRLLFISGSGVYGGMAGPIQESLRNARELGVEVRLVSSREECPSWHKATVPDFSAVHSGIVILSVHTRQSRASGWLSRPVGPQGCFAGCGTLL